MTIMSLILYLLITFVIPLKANDDNNCYLEEGYQYDDHIGGMNNQTSLRMCNDVREENICIVGGGLSGVHMGWLLKRRGFINTIIFEKTDRIGGMINSYYGGSDGIPRELSAAFLSPDYYEVRSLLERYSLTEVGVHLDMMQFHTFSPQSGDDIISSPDVWYDNALSLVTGSNDTDANNALVDSALDKYLVLHCEIFGDYLSRLPPKPQDPKKLYAIRGTFLEFLERNKLDVLLPMFFQFFVMQGMGTLKGMPAYYGLKWVSPASLNSGGLGNDPDIPLGMLQDGFSRMVTGLSEEAELDIKVKHEVVSVDRSQAATEDSNEPVVVTTKDFDGTLTSHSCDLLVLTGAIPQLTTGGPSRRLDNKVASTNEVGSEESAVLDSTEFEVELFQDKNAMQFMQSLVDINMEVNVNPLNNNTGRVISPYKALDYWAGEFPSRGGVIVHRDVGYAETGLQHTIGGVQSYSYLPPPRGATRDEMWSKQKKWMERYGYGSEQSGGYEVLGQFYIDTYLYHYEEADILLGKPWELDQYQGIPGTRTLYVGGAVSFESMEDVISFNLDLVKRKFDDSDIFDAFV